ncbi:ferredoxin [Lentinus tigrinus ALCF2SS1-7]|uniref:ferredoxin n=1 Tax=Lentinus tigrinus ALCF2SS1-7 TaxID=1328758 RepID=UPI0011662BCF|nr:ferredoxin [Lentinus tigrinus ALCF2SS1-7]
MSARTLVGKFAACPPTRIAFGQRQSLRIHLRRPQRCLSSHAPSQVWLARSAALPVFSRTRDFHSSPASCHGGVTRPKPGEGIKVHFKDSKGNLLKTVEANEGDDILSIAHEYDIDLEGACEGSVACSTCHVILDPESYDKLPEPEDDENDMLDMAFGLTDTSRLGCQVRLTRDLDGMTATLPAATRNMFVDGA